MPSDAGLERQELVEELTDELIGVFYRRDEVLECLGQRIGTGRTRCQPLVGRIDQCAERPGPNLHVRKLLLDQAAFG